MMMHSVHGWLSDWVDESEPFVAKFQKACGVDAKKKRGNWLLHILFTLGATAGNEEGFICCFPFVFFAWDLCTARKAVIVWAANYYIGQALKDLIALPRPRITNIVARLETHYQAEYGLPSTHALNACCMPWFMVWSSYGRVDDAWMPYLCAFAATWTTLTTLSRLYMGVHTPADLVTGCLLGFAILAGGIALSGWMDSFLLLSPWAPLSVLLGLPLALYAYPRQAQWTNSLGDTTVVTSASLGVVLTSWLQPQAHLAACAARIEPVSGYQFLANLPAYLLGCAIIIGSRSVAKAVVLPLWRRVVATALYRQLVGTGALHAKQAHVSTSQPTAEKALVSTNSDKDLSIHAGSSADPALRSVLSDSSLVDPATPTSDATPNSDAWSSDTLGAVHKQQLPRSALHKRSGRSQPAEEAEEAEEAPLSADGLPPQLRMADEGESDADNIALQHRTSPGAQYGFRYDVEVPVKMLVYSCIGANANWTALLLLQWLGVRDFGLQAPW